MGVQIEVPDSVGLSDFELRMNLAAKLFERGLVTTEQGAAMVELGTSAFVQLLGHYGVSVIQYGVDEALGDLENARRASSL
ncbi:hypothetical protein LEM8419_00168 [Neolewinella maritima]|uniref:Uncharacterized protein n=1 Tax=Neolewinella maritima TaxID=1383882 RepID=A0ABN8F477_9BACT|nr:UPF0175 family protein [Neolewinella maritima]CAH0998853.1 hypothetical protein LEM8419_00168 [Neolewinella maritima]